MIPKPGGLVAVLAVALVSCAAGVTGGPEAAAGTAAPACCQHAGDALDPVALTTGALLSWAKLHDMLDAGTTPSPPLDAANSATVAYVDSMLNFEIESAFSLLVLELGSGAAAPGAGDGLRDGRDGLAQTLCASFREQHGHGAVAEAIKPYAAADDVGANVLNLAFALSRSIGMTGQWCQAGVPAQS